MEKNISMLDVALKILTDAKTSLPFRELYDKIAEELKMTDSEKKENIGIFYTYLTLDGHFVALTDNHWDLRSRQFKKPPSKPPPSPSPAQTPYLPPESPARSE